MPGTRRVSELDVAVALAVARHALGRARGSAPPSRSRSTKMPWSGSPILRVQAGSRSGASPARSSAKLMQRATGARGIDQHAVEVERTGSSDED